MASLNKVMLIGNLTRDPEKRYTPGGMAVSDVRLAVNRKYKASNGEWKEEVCFVPVTLWGKTAENCVEHKRKGDPLFVEGRLKMDEWEKDGQKFSKIVVVADSVQFLSRGNSARRDADSGEGYDEGSGGRPAEPSGGVHGGGGEEKPDDLPF